MPDVVVYRGRPGSRGSADDRLLAAMAAGRPVVVFESGLGAAEWIDGGRTGFVVKTDDDARRCIGVLARDAALRTQIGRAAREATLDLLRRQRERALRFYFGTSAE